MISEITVKNSKIGFIIDKHHDIFKYHFDAEYLILVVFLWYEMLKNEDSFWYPYFQIINVSDIPMLWTNSEIEEF